MKFDAQPILEGTHLRLRPLTPDDFDALYAFASDRKLWEQHPNSDRWKKEIFELFFQKALKSESALVAELIDQQSLVACSRFYDIDQGSSKVAIGFTFIDRKYWGGDVNREMKKLMLAHAFKSFENVVFHVGETNLRSRRALEKIGARMVGIVSAPEVMAAQENRVLYHLARPH
ncbi:MAG: GNAT family N-acetyltransferase [Cryobacterium sp.]|nr:GNAT family N-acetyltransferase [Oligoflexia bacterium]